MTERTPSTRAGRELHVRRAYQNGTDLTDKAAMSVLAEDILAIEAETESSLRARLAAEVRDIGPNDCGEPASTNEPRTFASGTGVGMAMMKSAVLQVIEGER